MGLFSFRRLHEAKEQPKKPEKKVGAKNGNTGTSKNSNSDKK